MKTIIKNLHDLSLLAEKHTSEIMDAGDNIYRAIGAPKNADEAAANARLKFELKALGNTAFSLALKADKAFHTALGFGDADFTIVTPVDIDNAYAASQQGE